MKLVKELARPEQIIFVGVIDPINSRIESPEEVRYRVLEAAEFIPTSQLGSTDDCGFSPFCGRVAVTALAAQELGFDI